MMKENKKAWMKIVEAVIAIMIIVSVLIFMIVNAPRYGEQENLIEIQRNILEQISSNNTLREDVLMDNNESIIKFIQDVKPAYLNFTARICNVSDVCGMPFYINKEVYADEILISSTLTKYSPKKLKLFVWFN